MVQLDSFGWSACMASLDQEHIPSYWRLDSLGGDESWESRRPPSLQWEWIKLTVSRPFLKGFRAWTFHSFMQTASPGLKECVSGVRLPGFVRYGSRAERSPCIYCLKVLLPAPFKFPCIPLTRGCPQRISETGNPVCLGVDLILSKATVNNWSQCFVSLLLVCLFAILLFTYPTFQELYGW